MSGQIGSSAGTSDRENLSHGFVVRISGSPPAAVPVPVPNNAIATGFSVDNLSNSRYVRGTITYSPDVSPLLGGMPNNFIVAPGGAFSQSYDDDAIIQIDFEVVTLAAAMAGAPTPVGMLTPPPPFAGTVDLLVHYINK